MTERSDILHAAISSEGNSHLRQQDAGFLIRGKHVLTSSEPEMISDGAVRVVGDTIADVGSFADLSARFPSSVVLGGPNDIVTPGFINTHGHFSEALVTGIAENYALSDWLRVLIDAVAPHLDRESAFIGTLLGGIQMLRTGITLTNDMFVCDPGTTPVTPGVVDGLEALGLKGIVSYGASDRRPGTSVEEAFAEHAALREAAASSTLSRFRVGIATVAAQSPSMFARSVEFASSLADGVHIHLHESREEIEFIRQSRHMSPIAYCAQNGLFASPTLAAHCVWLTDADVRLLASHGVGVAYNPVSNMILASGVCPVSRLRGSRIKVGFGVDGPASNDRQDMLEAIKTGVLLQRLDQLNPTALSARAALRMATIEGAAALHLDTAVGSLEPGKAADLVVFNGDSPALANVHDPFQAIVYCAGPREVKDVWVAGQRRIADGELLGVDVPAVVRESRRLAQCLAQRAGLGALSMLATSG
ncbi:amidohydrolase family protein [Actinoplanes regularis]|uniref:Cytosine/adenosine deaminase n=1 Tax=Actinoplanes regularis TaxID=52697 RepID=A0A238X7B9_9ACTN|nr:amidohydrolase [Actinoplanes regularis]GIE86474.1 amidohydrolase [Actinoplanes regularis]SNR54224.1 Cytosine/adenosine deaminase [Actinoplanes regularis]